MLKIENTQIFGLEPTMRGCRNPMNSWNKSDSQYCIFGNQCGYEEFYDCLDCELGNGEDSVMHCEMDSSRYVLGSNDLKLAKKLAAAGPVHAKYRRMITVYADVTAPLYWWSEYDTYKVGTVANSCSKMHKLMDKPFEMSDFSFDKIPGYRNEVKQFRPEIDEETEYWVRYDDNYEVSDCGRIRHGKRILSGSIHQDGYVFVTIYGEQRPLHRLIAETFIENPQNKPEVNHIDGNKQNNFVCNLEWVTRTENIAHSMELRLQPMPVNTYTGKFSLEQREEIKKKWDSGLISKRKLAEEYGVSHTCINDIINDRYRYAEKTNIYKEVAKPFVDMLNELRDSYFRENDEKTKKQIWYTIIQLLPESYNQKRTVMMNYEVLTGMYKYRKNHKLSEWHTFCDWIESLPYSVLITGKEKENDNSNI